MKNKNILFVVLGLLCSLQPAFSQSFSNKGKEFWVGYGLHQFMERDQVTGSPLNTQQMVIYISTEQAATVTVTIDSSGNAFSPVWTRTYNVPANSVISTETATPVSGAPLPLTPSAIPKAGTYDARLFSDEPSFGGNGGEGLFRQKGIHITSNVPIVAYAHIYGSTSSGASMLLPVETWGYSYVTLNSNQQYPSGQRKCFSYIYVIAQKDSTLIEITPSVQTRLLKPANVPFTAMLMKGQIYQVVGNLINTSPGDGYEMTGTKVKSIANSSGKCFPIAVFAGSSRTSNVPASCGGAGGGDNDNQQCFPTQSWGKRYLTAPTSNSTTPSTPMFNTYKIAVKDPAITNVYRNGVLMTGIISNSYYKFTSNEAEYITSDQPIMVAQYIHGGSACMGGGGLGDPEMMYISPIEQGIKKTGFFRNNKESISVNYLTLVIPTAGVASLLIDGSSTFNHTYPHPKLAGYTVVVKRWSGFAASPAPPPGQCIVQSDSAFTAITYGLGGVESYGYNAGTLINNLNAVGSIFNSSDSLSNNTSHPFTCTNTPVKLSVLLAYQPTKLVWELSQVGGGLTPNADIIDNAPVSVGTVLVNGISFNKYTLPGNYSFSTAGTFNVPLLATHPSIENCTNTEPLSFPVEIRGKPIAGFTVSHTGCISDAVQFNGPAVSTNGYNLNQWQWTYPGAITGTGQNPTHVFTTTGLQPVNLHMVTTEGCVADTIQNINIFPKPTASISQTPLTACEGGTVTFTGTSSYSGSGSISNYYWNFGNGTATTAGPHTITYPNPGTYTIQYIAGVSATCLSEPAEIDVVINAKPNTTFIYPAGCLPANGTVQFTSTPVNPGFTYLWNFGDPASGALNTSTLANPTHTYPGFGTYTLNYSVTNTAGCSKDTTVSATFNLSPAFAYPPLSPVCESVTGTVSVATASVTNGVTGTGEYHGIATTLSGLFSPSAAGPGLHPIFYVFSATSGCKDSIRQDILVHPKPLASFNIPSATCLPTSGNVQFNYNGSVSAGQTYLWNFGDPASGALNTSTLNSPSHNYTNGNYTIGLTVTSQPQGCVDDTVFTTSFNVTPALNYPPLPPVCQSTAGTVSVATATVTNGVGGTGVYSGTATDAAGNFNPSLAGPGPHLITYTFTSTGNCVATQTSTITVGAKPLSSFTIPTASCIPSTGLVQFTYNGSAATSYSWNFGDPASGVNNTSTAVNPPHNFTTSGSYNIVLTVTGANGCTDDTTITRVFNITPDITYLPLPPVCQSVAGTVSVATAIVTNGVTGTGVYSGPGTDAAGNFNPAIAGAGTHPITYTFTSAGNCVASKTSFITVGAKPLSSFTFSPATTCIPANGIVQFTYNGSAVTGHSWNFGDPASGVNNTSTAVNPPHTYTNTGTYDIVLTVTGANGCTDDTTITRTFSVTPAVSYNSPLPSVCQSVTGTVSVATATVTNGVAGTGVYSGTATDAAGNFNPSVAGPGPHLITYTFTSTGNCIVTRTNTITVLSKPLSSFTFSPATTCIPANGIVQFTYNGSAVGAHSWNFGDPASGVNNTSTAVNPPHTYTNTGTYDIVLSVTGANGCTDDTTITRTFSVTPAVTYNSPLPSVCQSVTGTVSVATATVTNGVAGTGVYSGTATDAAGNFNPSVAGPGPHLITYTFTSTGNCIVTRTNTITVLSKPLSSFTFSPATTCIPANGIVQFTYNGSAVTGHSWNFGDPASGVNNTSTAVNPPHTYTNTGTYDIVLTVTGANGCTDDTTITRTFSVSPDVIYPVLTPVCESTTGTISVATASVTNGVAGTGVYTGTGVDAAGNFNPSVAGPGPHLITYTFTSTGNCIVTKTSTITVHPKPVSTINANDICLNQSTLITNTSTISSGSIATWKWFYGNTLTDSYNNGASFNYTYNSFGNYTIQLVTVSDKGCVSDTAEDEIRVHSVPVANFTLPASVCMPNGAVTFQNNSSNPDNNSLTYLWNFDDPASGGLNTSTLENPAPHVYAASASYDISLTATSAFGCVKETIINFSAFFDKPLARFDVSPDRLCQGIPNVFDNQSSAPNSTIKDHLWTFDDGTTSSLPVPVKTFQQPGSYDVQLVVTNNQNCVSEPFFRNIIVYLQPAISAGPSFVVPLGSVFQFQASSNSAGLTYLWTGPGLSDNSVLNPMLQANVDANYVLTATGEGNCTATSQLNVKIVRPIKLTNAFSPNGDGVNETWEIENLKDYLGSTIQVFNRYGQMVYNATGYGRPWDGTMKGKPLPVATYYYIIDLKNGSKPLNGSVTIVR